LLLEFNFRLEGTDALAGEKKLVRLQLGLEGGAVSAKATDLVVGGASGKKKQRRGSCDGI
jgi:hypothetical protein